MGCATFGASTVRKIGVKLRGSRFRVGIRRIFCELQVGFNEPCELQVGPGFHEGLGSWGALWALGV